MEINGLDTIQGWVGHPPKRQVIPYNLIQTEDLLRKGWNHLAIAIIPYCFTCREPLVWHTPPEPLAFHCPKCGGEWELGTRSVK